MSFGTRLDLIQTACRFDNTNTHSLIKSMSEEERRTFHFDVGYIEWEDYIVNVHIPGLRRHVVKERGLQCSKLRQQCDLTECKP